MKQSLNRQTKAINKMDNKCED